MSENNSHAGAVCSGAGARGDNERRDGAADKRRRASGSRSEQRKAAARHTEVLADCCCRRRRDICGTGCHRTSQVGESLMPLCNSAHSVSLLCAGAEGGVQSLSSPVNVSSGTQSSSHSPEVAVQQRDLNAKSKIFLSES